TPRRPRTLWVGVGTGAANVVTLHDALEPQFMKLGCYRREERAFTPHVTLGRIRVDRGAEALSIPLTKAAGWGAGAAMVQEVMVMGSELTPDGPVYTVLSRAKLA